MFQNHWELNQPQKEFMLIEVQRAAEQVGVLFDVNVYENVYDESTRSTRWKYLKGVGTGRSIFITIDHVAQLVFFHKGCPSATTVDFKELSIKHLEGGQNIKFYVELGCAGPLVTCTQTGQRFDPSGCYCTIL